MSDEIIKVIDAIAEKFGIAIDWTAENVMPLVTETLEQLITYKKVLNGTFSLIFLLFIITSATVLIIGLKSYITCKKTKINTTLWEFNPGYRIYATNFYDTMQVISILVIFVSFTAIWFPLTNYLKLTFAPNVYILEYLKSML